MALVSFYSFRTWRDDIADPLDGDGNDEYDEDLDDSDEELVSVNLTFGAKP